MQNELFYWDRQKSSSSVELDYVINVNDNIILIEIKGRKKVTYVLCNFFK